MPILRTFSSLPNEPDDGGLGNQLTLLGHQPDATEKKEKSSA
jgi:hypothetical protein